MFWVTKEEGEIISTILEDLNSRVAQLEKAAFERAQAIKEPKVVQKRKKKQATKRRKHLKTHTSGVYILTLFTKKPGQQQETYKQKIFAPDCPTIKRLVLDHIQKRYQDGYIVSRGIVGLEGKNDRIAYGQTINIKVDNKTKPPKVSFLRGQNEIHSATIETRGS